jgi:hypothetical protein
MRTPNELDMVILLGWLDRRVATHPATKIGVVSPVYGPLCGYVPDFYVSAEKYTLSNQWFDPFWSDTPS